MAFDINNFIGGIIPSGSGSMMGSMLSTFMWTLIVGSVIAIIIIIAKNKIKYQYYGIVFKRRQEGIDGTPQAMIVQGKAGYFKTKSGRTVFRIKYGMMPWQKIETSTLPDPKYIMGNTVIILQVQKDNFAQAKIKINWEGNQDFKLEPIDDSIKFDALQELNEIDRVLDTKKISPMTVGMVIIGLIIVTGIIVYYFLGKAGGG